MGKIPGYNGTVTVDGVTQCAYGWSFSEEININETPTFCSGQDMEYTQGLKTSTGTISTYDRITDSTGTIVLSNSNVGSVTITAEVIFNSTNIENQVGETQIFEHSFTCDGGATLS